MRRSRGDQRRAARGRQQQVPEVGQAAVEGLVVALEQRDHDVFGRGRSAVEIERARWPRRGRRPGRRAGPRPAGAKYSVSSAIAARPAACGHRLPVDAALHRASSGERSRRGRPAGRSSAAPAAPSGSGTRTRRRGRPRPLGWSSARMALGQRNRLLVDATWPGRQQHGELAAAGRGRSPPCA